MSDHVVVTGRGSASAVPDTVVLRVRTEVEEKDVSRALAGAASTSRALLEVADAHGVTDRDRRTTGLGLRTRWDRDGDRVVGHVAHQGLRLRVRDTTAVGGLLDALAGAAGDAFRIESLDFAIEDPGPLEAEARAAAFADARVRAQQYAELAGRELGPVLRVVEGDATPGPVPRAAFAAESGPMPVAAGENTVHAQVTVRFRLGAP